MLSLRDEIRSDPLGVAAPSHQDQFRRSGDEINSALPRHQFFRCGNVAVSRSYDFIDARHGFCSKSKGGDGLRAAQVDKSSLRPINPPPQARPARAGEKLR